MNCFLSHSVLTHCSFMLMSPHFHIGAHTHNLTLTRWRGTLVCSPVCCRSCTRRRRPCSPSRGPRRYNKSVERAQTESTGDAGTQTHQSSLLLSTTGAGLLFHLSHEQSKPSRLTAIKMNYCDCGAAEMKHSSTRVQLQLQCRWLGSFSCQDNRWGFQTEHSFYRETVDQMFGDVVKKVDTDRPANCSESASKQTLRLEFSASR